MGQKFATYDSAQPGYNVTGHYDSDIHAEIPVGAVPISDEQWQLSCEGRLCIEAGVAAECVPAGPALDDLKAAKKAEINAARAAAKFAGIDHNGYRWQTDKEARDNINGTLTTVNAGAPLPAEFTWRTEDNQDVPMDAAGLTALSAAILAQDFKQYQQSWAMKAQVDTATTAAEVAAIAW